MHCFVHCFLDTREDWIAAIQSIADRLQVQVLDGEGEDLVDIDMDVDKKGASRKVVSKVLKESTWHVFLINFNTTPSIIQLNLMLHLLDFAI